MMLPARVHVVFIDGNATWTERGLLRRYGIPTRRADGSLRTLSGWVLLTDNGYQRDGGTRVFPVSGRQVWVYPEDYLLRDEPDDELLIIRTADGEVLVDRTTRPADHHKGD
jgi:hypothetical protein